MNAIPNFVKKQPLLNKNKFLSSTLNNKRSLSVFKSSISGSNNNKVSKNKLNSTLINFDFNCMSYGKCKPSIINHNDKIKRNINSVTNNINISNSTININNNNNYYKCFNNSRSYSNFNKKSKYDRKITGFPPIQSIEKLYEENMQLKNKNISLNKQIQELKCEKSKKEVEILKNDKIFKQIICNEDYKTTGIYNNNFLDKTNFCDITSSNYKKIKDNQLIKRLKSQFTEIKKELKKKDSELLELKSKVKNTKLKEIVVENQILKQELIKAKSVFKEENENLKLINSKYYKDILDLQETSSLMNIEYAKLKESLNKKIKYNIVNEINKLYSLESKNSLETTEISKIKEKIESIIISNNKNLSFDCIKEQIELVKKENKNLVEENNTLRININNLLNSSNNEIAEDKHKKNEDAIISPKVELTELSTNTKIMLNKNKLNDLNCITEDIVKLIEDENNKTIKKGLKKLCFNYTEIKNNYKANNNFIFNMLYNNKTNSIDEKSICENKKNNNNKLNLLDEDELNEYTYILIKNLEALNLITEQLVDIIFDFDLEASNALNNLYNRLLSILQLTNRSEKDKLQSYLITLNSIAEGNFYEVKERILSFFEAINCYSEEQIELYEAKLKKRLKNEKNNLKVKFKEYDVDNTNYITFEQLRAIMEDLNIVLKETYMEYLIYKMKESVDDNKELKMYYLYYPVIIDTLNDSNTTNIIKENESAIKDNSSLDDEDLKEGLDSISYNKTSQQILNNKSVDNNITKSIKDNSSNDIKSSKKTNKYSNEIKCCFNGENLENSNSSIKQSKDNSNKINKVTDIKKLISKTNIDNSIIKPTEIDNIEITIEEYNKRNELTLYKIAEYLLSNESYIGILFDSLKHEVKIIDSDEFFKLLSELNIELDAIDKYCILLKLGNSDNEGFIDIEKLKDEMSNYGIIEKSSETVNNNYKKYTNNYKKSDTIKESENSKDYKI